MVYLGYLIILFFIFSVLGWIMEVVLKFIQFHRFINRGYLIGPYCPIYGAGVVAITLMVELLPESERSIGTVFLLSFVGCGLIEYLTSYIMEKQFHTRWWDYSNKPMNLHGRVWIGNLILFGLAGVLIAELVNPFLFSLLEQLPNKAIYIISAIIIVLIVADYAVSGFIMKFVKVSVESSEADSTEAIGKEIKMLLTNKSVLYKRIADAYPEAVYRTEKINEHLKAVKAEMDRMEQEAKDNIDLFMTRPMDLSEEVIKKQDELIACMNDESSDPATIQQLQNEIADMKAQLEARQNMGVVGLNKKLSELKNA